MPTSLLALTAFTLHVLKASAFQVTPILTAIFNRFLTLVCSSCSWKHVTPVFERNGARSEDLSGYRPISTTAFVCRAMNRALPK